MNIPKIAKKISKIILLPLGIALIAYYLYSVALAALMIIFGIISSEYKPQTSSISSILQDGSGYRQIYRLPDGCTFTIWEKEPGKYGSEVLIIPGEYKKMRTPNISHIKTSFGSHTPTLLYHLFEKYSSNERFETNKIFLKIDTEDSTSKENLYEIVNIKKSNWEISVYSDKDFNKIFIGDSINSQMRSDISLISIDMDEHYIEYKINHGLYLVDP